MIKLNRPSQRLYVESINLLPFNTGSPHHVIPGQYAETTMFSKIAGILLRITQCQEVDGKTPGYTYSLKTKKEKNYFWFFLVTTLSRFNWYWNCVLCENLHQYKSFFVEQMSWHSRLQTLQHWINTCIFRTLSNYRTIL